MYIYTVKRTHDEMLDVCIIMSYLLDDETFLSIYTQQEAQLSPSNRAMRLVSYNLANFHATVQNYLYDKS